MNPEERELYLLKRQLWASDEVLRMMKKMIFTSVSRQAVLTDMEWHSLNLTRLLQQNDEALGRTP